MAHAGPPPPMAGIPPPMIYQNMNYPLPVNHPIWGHNIRHPRECQSSYHVNSRPMPSMNALHEEWQEYYLDRKAMIVAAGKTIEYVVGLDRNNGAPHGRPLVVKIHLYRSAQGSLPTAGHRPQSSPSYPCSTPATLHAKHSYLALAWNLHGKTIGIREDA